MSNMSASETAKEINQLFRSNKGDVVTLKNERLKELYGGSKYPREEARTKIQEELKSEYHLHIFYMDRVAVVTRDEDFAPA